MKITEKINLFIERKEYKRNGETKILYKLTTSIRAKKGEDEYVRMSVDVIANPKKYPEAVLAKLDPAFMYVANVKNGWLTIDEYVSKDGKRVKKLVIFIDEMKLESKSPIDLEKREKSLQSAKGGADGENDDLPF